jgi:hypothetical protein
MTSIDSGTSSTLGLDNAALIASSDGAVSTAQGVTTPESASANAGTPSVAALASSDSVSAALQAAKQSSTTAKKRPANDLPASRDQISVMNKVVDALVGVVSALVNLVNGLIGQFKGTPMLPSSATNSGVSSQTPNSNASVANALDVNRNDAGMVAVRTLDGFTVRAEGRDQAWSITGPDGQTTRIWGDPHVTESDGDKWDFLNRSTFMFGKNKATIEVVPAGNGQTLSARLTVYSDRERVTIDGIERNQPNVIAASSDGLQHDATLADGQIYKRVSTNSGEAWVSVATGKVVPVTR